MLVDVNLRQRRLFRMFLFLGFCRRFSRFVTRLFAAAMGNLQRTVICWVRFGLGALALQRRALVVHR